MMDFSKYPQFYAPVQQSQYEKNEASGKYGPWPAQGGYLGSDWPKKDESVSRPSSVYTSRPAGPGDVNYRPPRSTAGLTSPVARVTSISQPQLQQIGQTTQYIPPEGEMPVAPDFEMPVYDEARERALGREAMAPALAESRRGLRELITSAEGEENPNVRRMISGEALRGYGGGLGNILASGREAGRRQYGDIYGRTLMAAKTAHEAKMQNWQALIGKYMESGKTKVTPQYGRMTAGGMMETPQIPYDLNYNPQTEIDKALEQSRKGLLSQGLRLWNPKTSMWEGGGRPSSRF